MPFLGALYLTAAASIWGGMYVVSKYVLDYIPPFTLLAIRLAIALAILAAAMFMGKGQWRIAKEHRLLLGSLGLIGFTFSLGLQFWGTKLSTAHNGGLITSASPAFIVLFAMWILKERLTRQNLLALALATAGVMAVVGPESQGEQGSALMLGNLFLVGAGISWALYTVLGKLATQYYTSLTVSTYATLSGLIFNIPMAWLTEWRTFSPGPMPAMVWWGVAYVGVISTAVAFYLWVKGFSMMPAGPASLFFFAQPLVAAILGALLLGETLHWYFYVGAALILAGLVVSSRETEG